MSKQNKPTDEQTSEQTSENPYKRELTIRFFASDRVSAKAPVAYGEIELLDLPGMVLGVSVWARRDERDRIVDHDVTIDGSNRYGSAIRIRPAYVMLDDGSEAPLARTVDPVGKVTAETLPGVLKGAFFAWLKDPKHAAQSINF